MRRLIFSKLKCVPSFKLLYWYIHHTILFEFAITFVGFKSPFLVGCHCFANSGFTVCKSLNPLYTAWPLKYGHPLPLFRLLILAFQWRTHGWSHGLPTVRQAFLVLRPGYTFHSIFFPASSVRCIAFRPCLTQTLCQHPCADSPTAVQAF